MFFFKYSLIHDTDRIVFQRGLQKWSFDLDWFTWVSQERNWLVGHAKPVLKTSVYWKYKKCLTAFNTFGGPVPGRWKWM